LQTTTGITVCSFYFYLFFKSQPLSPQEIFRFYATVTVYICVIGLIMSLVQSLYAGTFVPVQSIMREPQHLGSVALPAFHYFLCGVRRGQGGWWQLSATLAAILLSGSSTAFLGLSCSLLLTTRKHWYSVAVIPVLTILLVGSTYLLSDHFRTRLNDTARVFIQGNVGAVNLSTYTLLSNGYVSWSAWRERPLFGYGIGGHEVAHAKYIGAIPGGEFWQRYLEVSAKDADSLLLRTASELGSVGLALVFAFIWKCHVPGNSSAADISSAVVIYFALKLLREGHWFSPEMYFFVWIYVLLWRFHGSTRLRACALRGRQSSPGMTLIGSAVPRQLCLRESL